VVKKGFASGVSGNRNYRIPGEIIKAQHVFQDIYGHSTMDRVIFPGNSGKCRDTNSMVRHSFHRKISPVGFLFRFRICALVCPGTKLLLSAYGQIPAF
jgi:hypothetical protein